MPSNSKWYLAFGLLFVFTASIAIATEATGSTRVIIATQDITGTHQAQTAILGPAAITCTSATTDTPDPNAPPLCSIMAPGWSGPVNIGSSVGANNAGTVILTCGGRGTSLRCTATIKEKNPPEKDK